MAKAGLNTHVFGQSVYNWLPLPSETGKMIELPIPPVEGMKEALVFISATFNDVVSEDHYYACYTRAMEGGLIPFHYLFLVGAIAKSEGGCNSDSFWLPMPDEGSPRVVYIQKMCGGPLPASAGFRSGATVLTMR